MLYGYSTSLELFNSRGSKTILFYMVLGIFETKLIIYKK